MPKQQNIKAHKNQSTIKHKSKHKTIKLLQGSVT